MARKNRSSARKRRAQEALAPKLIGAGALLTIAPLFLGASPLAAGLRPLLPFGLLLLVAGIALLWWQIQTQRAAAPSAPAAREARSAPDPPKPLVRSSNVRVQPDRTSTELERPKASGTAKARQAERGPKTWGTEVFDVIEWRRFEALVEALFAQAGFETKSLSHGADEGIDVWLYSRNKPGEPVSVVQCKHWRGKRVGVDKIRELRGVMAAKNVARGQFATTSTFTPDAEAFAKANGINLLDVQGLLSLIAKRTAEQQAALLEVATEGEYWRPTCVNCGVKMVERTARKGGAAFWGCSGYPRCTKTMAMTSDRR